MKSIPLLVIAVCLVAGCASTPQVKQAGPAIVMASRIPSLLQGQPLTNAELASYLAEYELARQGVDCRNDRMTVSFCEGIYTVAFHPADRASPIEKYVVEIDAGDSTIVRMIKKPRAGA